MTTHKPLITPPNTPQPLFFLSFVPSLFSWMDGGISSNGPQHSRGGSKVEETSFYEHTIKEIPRHSGLVIQPNGRYNWPKVKKQVQKSREMLATLIEHLSVEYNLLSSRNWAVLGGRHFAGLLNC